MSSEVLGNGLIDFVIAQVYVTAALLAHCGFCSGSDQEVSPTLETFDRLLLDDRLFAFDLGHLLNAEMLLAAFAYRRISATRLGLCMAAFWARDRDKILFWGRHGLNNAPTEMFGLEMMRPGLINKRGSHVLQSPLQVSP
jgi:hypothetical protein